MNSIDEMSITELSRWAALCEGVNLVAEECEDRGIKFENITLEPLHLRKFVEKTCDLFARKILLDQENAQKKLNLCLFHKQLDKQIETIKV